MSVPAWKQAIYERRKKQEDEQKKKQAEEEAYLATLPPWKRALYLKRERERQQQEKEKSSTSDSCERSESFLQRQQQLAEEREQRKSSGDQRWRRRATPPLSPNEATSPSSPPYDHARHFFPSAPSTQPSRQSRRSSITTLPGVDEVKVPIAEKVATAEIPTWQNRARSLSASSGTTTQKVVSNVKKFNEVKTQSSEMPAWKKALLQRRKEKEMKSGGRQRQANTHADPAAPAVTLPVDRRESPTEERTFKKDKHVDSEAASLLVVKRKPSPEEMVAVSQESSLQLQRKPSPNESEVSLSRSPTPERVLESTQALHGVPERAPRKVDSKPPGLSRKMSPIESVGVRQSRSESPTEAKNRVSSITSSRKSSDSNTTANTKVSTKVKTETGSKVSSSQRPTPIRTAPVAPTSAEKQSLAKHTKVQQPKQIPEVVNRGIGELPKQSHVIQREGVTQRAPIYKEVAEWANVSDDDPKFLSLPTWKQALIKRRRADVAKRMGLTTSIDDVPLSNGPIPRSKQESVPSEDRTGSVPPWKRDMLHRRAEGGTSGRSAMSNHEKKHLAGRRSSPDNSSSNVRALMGRFNEKTTPSPPPSPSSTVPVVTISKPRSPSPSSEPSTNTETRATSSTRPAYSSSGVPQVSSSSSAHSKKSFTWTPGEDSMPGDALSDDSSDEEEEYTLTNIDDISDEEEEGRDSESEGDSSGVVLLRPPQALVSPNANEQGDRKVRKASSILVDSNRPRRRVSSCFVHLL